MSDETDTSRTIYFLHGTISTVLLKRDTGRQTETEKIERERERERQRARENARDPNRQKHRHAHTETNRHNRAEIKERHLIQGFE